MLGETLVLPQILRSLVKGEGTDLSQLSMLRMLRLLRLTRMVRLMRSVPALVTLIKSMRLAARSVLSTLLLLFIFVYIFAIIIRSQFKPTNNPYLEARFDHLQDTMWNLLVRGAFLDGPRTMGANILQVKAAMIIVFVVFLWISALMILNMLVGLLCDVVEAVAAAEKEKAMVSYVKSRLIGVLEALDEDGNGTISKDEFMQLLDIPEAVESLQELGVDVQNLMSLCDHLFEAPEFEAKRKVSTGSEGSGASLAIDFETVDRSFSNDDVSDNSFEQRLREKEQQEEEEVVLTWGDFLEMVIKLRANHKPSVADLVDLRKLFVGGQNKMIGRLDNVEEQHQKMNSELKALGKSLDKITTQHHMAGLMSWLAEGLRHAKMEAITHADSPRDTGIKSDAVASRDSETRSSSGSTPMILRNLADGGEGMQDFRKGRVNSADEPFFLNSIERIEAT